MKQLALCLCSLLLDLTKRRFGGDYTDIEEVLLFRHRWTALLFSHANRKRLEKKHGEISLSDLCKLGLLPEELGSPERLFSKEELRAAEEFSVRLLEQDVRLGPLRECLLSLEPSFSRHELSLREGKHLRDLSGSYYTPRPLAEAIVRELPLSPSLLFGGDLPRIADLSCGCGEFFRAVQRLLKGKYGIGYGESALFFWGFDVDPIALQIAVCSLLEEADPSDWSKIEGHYRLGNPLIAVGQESSPEEKNRLFALHRIYAAGMGIAFDPSLRFDVIVGNPPWEKIRFEERAFFSNYDAEIAKISKKDVRRRAIDALQTSWKELYLWEQSLEKDYAAMGSKTYRHPLISDAVAGELNTYALFTELCFRLLKEEGAGSLIIKSTLATAPVHAKLWHRLLKEGAVSSLSFFDNKNKIFGIDSRERFAVLTLSRKPRSSFRFSCGLRSAEELGTADAVDVTEELLHTLNPLKGMLPNLASTGGFKTLLDLHRTLPLFDEVYRCRFGRLVHLTAHAAWIRTSPSEDTLPVYEGKFLEQYDARFSTFAGVPEEKKYAAKASAVKIKETDGKKPFPESRYFLKKELWEKYQRQYSRPYSLCWRSLTSPTNARTMIAMILPTCPTCQSVQLLQTEDDNDLLLLLGLFNSLPFDRLVRMKMPGLDLTQSVVRQIPVPPRERYLETLQFDGVEATLQAHILSLVCFLLKDEETLSMLLPPISYPTEGLTKKQARARLDLAFAHAYGIGEDGLREIEKEFR